MERLVEIIGIQKESGEVIGFGREYLKHAISAGKRSSNVHP
jgi:hypothetical protein